MHPKILIKNNKNENNFFGFILGNTLYFGK